MSRDGWIWLGIGGVAIAVGVDTVVTAWSARSHVAATWEAIAMCGAFALGWGWAYYEHRKGGG